MLEQTRKASWPSDELLDGRLSGTPRKKTPRELMQSQVTFNYERKLLSKKLM